MKNDMEWLKDKKKRAWFIAKNAVAWIILQFLFNNINALIEKKSLLSLSENIIGFLISAIIGSFMGAIFLSWTETEMYNRKQKQK
jgi:ABC-type nitrate/sulfonate/bicarbonate transport system permease component